MIIGKASWTGDGTSPKIITDTNSNTGIPIAIFGHGVNQADHIWVTGMTQSVPIGLAAASTYPQGIMSASNGCFAVGSDNVLNKSGTNYWADIIYSDSDNRVDVGSYVGSAASRNIQTTDATPWSFVITIPTSSASDKAVWKTTEMGASNSLDFSSTGNIVTTSILGLGTGTFSVSSVNTVNRSGETFFYLAMASTANIFQTFNYTGTGATQNVGAIGWTPTSGLVKGNTNTAGWHRHGTEVNPGMIVSGGSELQTGIYAFFNGGFSIGTNAALNTNAVTYYAAAFLDTTPPPALGLVRSNRLLMGY